MEGRILVGWRRVFTGPDVSLVAPEGAGTGLVRIRQRLAPLIPARAIFEPLLAEIPGATVKGPEPLVTAEGEHGAFVSAAGQQEQRTVAVVFGDEHYAMIEGHAATPELHGAVSTAVRNLAYGHCLGLGSDRWRRFYYEPPRDWAPIARPFATMWYAPTCPRRHQTITVFHARPPRGGYPALVRQQLFESLGAEYGEQPPSEPTYEGTTSGLIAQLVSYRGRPAHRPEPVTVINAVVRDNLYLYPFRLECDSDVQPAAEEAFRAVVKSMRPVPGRAPATGAMAGSTWAE